MSCAETLVRPIKLAHVALLASGLASGMCASFAANAQPADLSQLSVIPERGQSAAQARRDRYECHNWAVEQTGEAPVRYDEEAAKGEDRERRINRVLIGAAIGAAVGSIVRGNDHRRGDEAADGALGGAILGAAAGAVSGSGSKADTSDDPNTDYLRALSACLEGRGYAVSPD